jgi:phosphoserine phosphatase
VVGTWERHAHDLFNLVRRLGVDGQIVFNREAVMLLPTGINKATGIQRALEELGRSEHNLVAFGDAENDLPLFAVAEWAVAARGSVPAVAGAGCRLPTQRRGRRAVCPLGVERRVSAPDSAGPLPRARC